MSHNFIIKTPPKIKVEESAIYGLWDVVQISACNENTEPIAVTQRTKYHFLQEMMYIRVKDGVASHGTWELSEFKDEKVRHLMIINNGFDFEIIYLDADELILSDGSIEYRMIRRI